jgi:SAM-dependent methyltransferase
MTDTGEVFKRYSDWYDALYSDKDYPAEARYVLNHLPDPGNGRPILELGCGTGRHALEFARAGRGVVAVDRSPGMLARARQLVGSSLAPLRERVRLVHSDAQRLNLDERFSAAVSLFHVMSYQVAQDDLEAFFRTAARHLVPGGVFLFDFWYGPAVLFQRPETRSRKIAAAGVEVHRVSVPELDPAANVVHVHFDTYVRRPGSAAIEHVAERHSMRYFFETEIRDLASRTGFASARLEEWVTGRPPGTGTWGVAAILTKG